MTESGNEWLVLTRIAAMFLVMGAGWIARRTGRLNEGLTSSLGRFTIDVAFPAFTLTQMIQLIDAASFASSLPVFALGAIIILVAALTGGLAAGFSAQPAHRRTFAFLVAIPNWIFLPLPIVQAMYGSAGVKTILEINIPAQVLLWTLGVAMLRGGYAGSGGLAALLRNPGLLATAAGIALGVLVPASKGWQGQASIPGAVIQGLALLGQLTVPLSLIVIGAQLGSLDAGRPPAWRELVLVMVARLLVAPAATVAALAVLAPVLLLTPDARAVGVIVASMPVAVSCGLFVDRFGGDRDLAARAILFSTIASIATVPLVIKLASWWL